ncbi:hypothetical protein OBBRIDRAFT_80643 [Obba rivulosa]|uniref:Aminoglycoside phosphotransferase domain-containing protein n=1 Tax=Obba rivulosa TaxID=1052685 RepID=A0A8E2APK2_9APHY|nr:hypothetical protein OBBRIDRAFT_80643 [Obba rivulosa]
MDLFSNVKIGDHSVLPTDSGCGVKWYHSAAGHLPSGGMSCEKGHASEFLDPPTPGGVAGHWPLVFVHADLNLSSILLSKGGVLWIVDWAASVFSPEWFESVAMRLDTNAPTSWKRWRWFIAGSNPRFEKFWDHFLQDVHRFRRSR